MRHRYIVGAVLAAIASVGSPSAARAQEQFQVPLNSDPVLPIPTGSPGQPGFYTGFEYVMLTQTKAIGDQTIAVRGFFDATGVLTGVPGTFTGSGTDALNTRRMGRREFMPGFRVELGYKFDTGTRAYFNYMQFYDAHYSAGASQAAQGFNVRPDNADSFLSSPVFNFNPAFGGPGADAAFDNTTNGQFNTFGIWNAADLMTIKFTQRYQQAEVGLRMPMFATEYSSIYSLSGARFAWIFERFSWRTVDIDQNGNQDPRNTANYSNTLSQRMYGLFVGCGHEIYLGSMFSASLDLTGALYMNVHKIRAKYKLGDESVQSKFGREGFDLVPSAAGEFNFWFYPTEGIQLKLGYQGITFFNTRQMREPVGFNFGNIDPNTGSRAFRLLHGFNVGIGFFF
jgi:hypothetical protein